MRTGVSQSLTNGPQFAGVSAVQISGVPSLPHAEVAIAPILAPQSLAPEIRFPACGQGHGQRLGSHATETGFCMQEIGEELGWNIGTLWSTRLPQQATGKVCVGNAG
jgi:hypothetical protein